MQIYENPVRPVKSETMQDAANDKTYAIFDTAANRKIVENLRSAGAKLFLFLPIETEKIILDETATEIFDDLNRFDWLIFTDVFAVEAFLENLEEMAIDAFELDALRVCALGEAVSDALRFASLHADVIPSKINAAETFSALRDYIGEREINGLKFLILADDKKQNALTRSLLNEKAEVIELPIYRAKTDESGELTKLKTLLKGGAIDEFILTAPADLVWLENYFQTETLADVLAEIQISATGGVMFQAARERGLERVGFFHLDKIAKVN